MSIFIDPDRDAFRQFVELGIEGQIQMLNLIKMKEQASYEDGREATGVEA